MPAFSSILQTNYLATCMLVIPNNIHAFHEQSILMCVFRRCSNIFQMFPNLQSSFTCGILKILFNVCSPFCQPPKDFQNWKFLPRFIQPLHFDPHHRFPPLLGKVKNPPPRWERCRVAPERARLWLHHGNSCPLLGSFLQGSGIKKIFELPPSSNCCFCGYRFGDVV